MTQVAETILAQLGGNRFRATTGASSFAGGPDSLSFRLPKAKQGIKGVVIKLNGRDLYDIEFGKIVTTKCLITGLQTSCEYKVLERREDVYAENLRDVFEDVTGLRTSL